MRVPAALAVAGLLASGCATYTVYSRSYGDGPSGETMGILLGAEAAAGLVTGVGLAIKKRKTEPWYESVAIGFLVPFVIDVAVALGVGTSDLVGE